MPYLVNNQVLPMNFAQRAFALQNTFIGRNEYVPLVSSSDWVSRRIFRHKFEALVFGAAHFDRFNGGAPCLDLTNPVRNDRFRRNNQVWARRSTAFTKIRKERNGLESLAKAPVDGDG